ncbi:hypothetical protein BD780_000308 [Clostridium tetanomorphum]|uniref:DUF2680 domain-containing protein n=1 Tax=Clostridium tetanomorphum TaxID=1553 RepID=A0A923EBG9_CLOTT|nr:hypothetical protein [Clostridium tetanomorphum]KAJ52937.1 hypothetical protein CTM_04768 [Clostridium tetanomorphum DSM 665]MBC2398191.1 hypothetical protein [Clostridium tetanomorphum]MBP1864877.1 hypothetical protein [Clostridium tetanomorphum]NRS83083.1 hypothetical protein [Clostridium tetanomorphum]NRZ98820.1 hypothetical protein [Clostridium tetanomorphum]
MKKKNIIAALALTLSIGMGATAYAAATAPANSNIANKINATCTRLGLGRITGMRGYDSATSILKDKLKLTDEDITKAREAGKTLKDLALEKGMTEDEFNQAMIDSKSKAIDEAVKNSTITKEEGDTIKENLKSNINNCTGSCGQMNKGFGNGQGNGRKMRGNGLGRGFNNNVNVQK